MPVTVGLYEKALARVAPRLAPLGLDIDFRTFDAAGNFTTDGKAVPPSDMALDYLWLSPDISAEGIQKMAFELALGLKSLGVLQTFNAGLDNPYYKKISDKGVRIVNSSAQAVGISEYVLANVLAVYHPFERQRELQRAHTWERTPFREISRTNWLIVGYGPIGQEVARRAKAFGATTTVIRRSPATGELVDRAGTLADLPNFLPDADVVVLACPLNTATRGMAGADFFAAMKPDAVLVNIARGALIDDAAMMAALDAGKFGKAVLDVFHTEPLPADDPLWAHPKIRITSHTSFSGSGVRQRWDDLFVDNLPRFVRGEPMRNVVNPDDIV